MIKGALLGLAGITLFLYGMTALTEVMKRVFTVRMKDNIRLMVKNRLSGFVTGILITVFFQSSSATTVLIVGLVSAGLVSFYHSLAVILGADVGTTVTLQLIAWRVGDLSPLFLIVGGVGWFLGEEKRKEYSSAVFNFGLMFFGLFLVSLATQPFKADPRMVDFFQTASHPLVAFSFGVVVTGLVHASAVVIGLIVFLAGDGLISLPQAIPVVLGANVGTTVTAILAALVSTPAGRRTAAAHFFFKLVGAILFLPFTGQLAAIMSHIPVGTGQKIVWVHLVFNVAIAIGFIFFTPVVARLLEKLLPGQERTIPLWPEYIANTFLEEPIEALEAARKEIVRQGEISRRMFELAAKSTVTFRANFLKDIHYLELVQNNLREEIVAYLRCISAHELSPPLAQKLFAYTAMADDIERMSNHMVSIVELAKQKAGRQIAFTSYAVAELEEIVHHVRANLSGAISLIEGTGRRKKWSRPSPSGKSALIRW